MAALLTRDVGKDTRARPAWAWQLDVAGPHPGSCREDGHSGPGAWWLLPGAHGAAGGSQSIQALRAGGRYTALVTGVGWPPRGTPEARGPGRQSRARVTAVAPGPPMALGPVEHVTLQWRSPCRR